MQQFDAQYKTLTVREAQVVDLIFDGMSNNQAADQIGISFRTVELHRGRAMQKLQCSNAVMLGRRMAEYRAWLESINSFDSAA